jgi:hypothetical protein
VPLAEPRPGLFVRYGYFWSHKAVAGRVKGKDRSVFVVAASDSQAEPRFVVLLPITHTPPEADTIGIEIPVWVKQAIGFDDAPSWVIVSEYSVDEWPKGGLSAVLGKPNEFSYDFIPPVLFVRIKAKFLELARERKSRRVPR